MKYGNTNYLQFLNTTKTTVSEIASVANQFWTWGQNMDGLKFYSNGACSYNYLQVFPELGPIKKAKVTSDGAPSGGLRFCYILTSAGELYVSTSTNPVPTLVDLTGVDAALIADFDVVGTNIFVKSTSGVGQWFCKGPNAFGILGLGDYDSRTSFVNTGWAWKELILCGRQDQPSAVAIHPNGTMIYEWGMGIPYTGVGINTPTLIYTGINENLTIQSVTNSSVSGIFISDNGVVKAKGNNVHNALGIPGVYNPSTDEYDQIDQIFNFMEIPSPGTGPIVKAIAKYAFAETPDSYSVGSLFLTQDGSLWQTEQYPAPWAPITWINVGSNISDIKLNGLCKTTSNDTGIFAYPHIRAGAGTPTTAEYPMIKVIPAPPFEYDNIVVADALDTQPMNDVFMSWVVDTTGRLFISGGSAVQPSRTSMENSPIYTSTIGYLRACGFLSISSDLSAFLPVKPNLTVINNAPELSKFVTNSSPFASSVFNANRLGAVGIDVNTHDLWISGSFSGLGRATYDWYFPWISQRVTNVPAGIEWSNIELVTTASLYVTVILMSTTGDIYAAGLNSSNELGSPGSKNFSLLDNTKSWKSYCGFTGIKNDGTLWTWGPNAMGQLGLGDYTARDVPTQVGVDTDWKQSRMITNSMLVAIKNDGTLWVSGTYASPGDTNRVNTITQLGTDVDWKEIIPLYSGDNVITLVKNNGEIWYVSTTPNSAPTRATKLEYTGITIHDDWVDISNIAYIRQDGTLWKYELAYSAPANNATLVPSMQPTQISHDNRWISVCDAGAIRSNLNGLVIYD